MKMKYFNEFHKIDFDILIHQFGQVTIDQRQNCPFESHHLAKSTNKDFKYHLSPAADNGFRCIGGSCWHQSCRDAINTHLHFLNKDWYRFVNTSDKITKKEVDHETLVKQCLERNKALLEQKKRLQLIAAQVASIQKNVVPLDSITTVYENPITDTIYHLSMFDDGDIVFRGDFNQSQGYLFALPDIGESGEFTSTHTFKDINGKRCSENCKDKPFGVLERDDGISKPDQLALLHSIAKTLNITLLMALDSGGKSIHGWFHWEDLEPHLDLFQQMNYDMKTLKSKSQPVRLAGVFRKDKQTYQRIVYIDEKRSEDYEY